MNKLIKYFNEKYSKDYGKISYPRTTIQIYRVYQAIKSYGINDDKLVELLHNVKLPKPRNTEEWELYVGCLYNMDDSELERKIKDIPKKTIVEDNKLYLVKSDGTKMGEGTELPSIDVSKKYVDTSLENKVDKINGKGLSTVDFTKSYETKLKGLENYNDAKVKEDIERLRINCRTIRERALVEFLLATGMRVSEIQKVNVSDLNFDSNKLKTLGKGNKERVVLFNDRCKLYIKEYLNKRAAADIALFVSERSPYKRLSVRAIQKILKNISLRKDFEYSVFPHKLRHTFATNMFRQGADLKTVQFLLGHKNISTTQIYVHVDDDGLRDAVKSNPLANINK